MKFWSRTIRTLVTTGAVVLSMAPGARADEPVGVVTNIEGTVTVARVALLQAQPLRFRDDVYRHDRITTGERSTVRVLLGGKATVTARERSVVTITEVPGIATIELGDGRISVAVSKAMMKRGEMIQIRTPNAVSAVRGTVVVAEVFPGTTVRSTITVLRGLVDVTRLDGDRLVGSPVSVAARQSIQVTGVHPLPLPRAISPAEAQRLTTEFRVIPGASPSAAVAPAVRHAMDVATQEAVALSANARSAADSNEKRGGRRGRGAEHEPQSDRIDGAAENGIGATGRARGDSRPWSGSGSSGGGSPVHVGVGSSGSGNLLTVGSGTSGGGSLLNAGLIGGGNSGPSRSHGSGGSSGSGSSGSGSSGKK